MNQFSTPTSTTAATITNIDGSDGNSANEMDFFVYPVPTEHPRYNEACEAFDHALKVIIDNPVPDAAYDDYNFIAEHMVTIADILDALTNGDEHVGSGLDFPANHPYRPAITQAKEIALKTLQSDLLPTCLRDFSCTPESPIPVMAQSNSIASVASSPATKDTDKDLLADYYFPASVDPKDDALSILTQSDLVDELESLTDQFKKPADYLTIRNRYCSLNIELNKRGLLAPAFRSGLTIPWLRTSVKPAHLLIQRDRVVIDCHWLHTKGYNIHPSEKAWRGLFKKGKAFPIDLAVEFAERNVANEYRAEAILGLTPFEQYQLQALRGDAVLARIKSLKTYIKVAGKRIPPHMETVTLAINRWCEKDRRVLPHKEKYLAHARASALLSISHHTQVEIGQLAAMIEGVAPLSESSVRSTLTKLAAHAPKSV